MTAKAARPQTNHCCAAELQIKNELGILDKCGMNDLLDRQRIAMMNIR